MSLCIFYDSSLCIIKLLCDRIVENGPKCDARQSLFIDPSGN